MPGYIYRGNQFEHPRKGPGGRPPTGLAPFDPALCGTNAGYHQHGRHKQEKCGRCKAAHRAYDADYRAKKRRGG